MIDIHCLYDKLIPIEDIVPHPDNENKHSEKQIEVLAKIIKKDGIRHPIVVSNLSGKIAMGHGRLLAFKKLGLNEAPVTFQEFEDPIQELRVRNSDNNIAKYSEFNRDQFEANLEELDLSLDDLDMEEFGELVNIDNKEIDNELPPELSQLDPNIIKSTFVLSTEQLDLIEDAIKKAKKELDIIDEINLNEKGNCLAAVCKYYVNS